MFIRHARTLWTDLRFSRAVAKLGYDCLIANMFITYNISLWGTLFGPLTRYVKLRVAHTPGMPGMFPRHRRQRKPLVSDPGMHLTHVPWCMSGSVTRDGGENVPGIPGACPARNFAYLVRGPFTGICSCSGKETPKLQIFSADHNTEIYLPCILTVLNMRIFGFVCAIYIHVRWLSINKNTQRHAAHVYHCFMT